MKRSTPPRWPASRFAHDFGIQADGRQAHVLIEDAEVLHNRPGIFLEAWAGAGPDLRCVAAA
jgi:hypothetical protein